MAVNWTPKQQEIICNRNRDLSWLLLPPEAARQRF